MKLKIAVLLMLLPLLIFAVDLNQNATIWTQDKGFFTAYRQIEVRARNVDGDAVIWGKEPVLPVGKIGYDPGNGYTVMQLESIDATLLEHLTVEDVYRTSSASGSWSISSVSSRTVNNFNYHDALSKDFLIAATNDGVFQSVNGGGNWSTVDFANLKGNISDAVLSPVNQSAPGDFSNKYFAAGVDAVYGKKWGTSVFSNWVMMPRLLAEEDFTAPDPMNLDSLPEGWTKSGMEDEFRYIRLDTLIYNSGDYSLQVYSKGVGGDILKATYSMPALDKIICGFDLYPLYHTGIISIKNEVGIKLAFRYGALSYYSEDGEWEELEETGFEDSTWNSVKLDVDFKNETAILIYAPDSKDTMALYDMQDDESEIVFSTEAAGSENAPYYIDDFYLQPEVYSLAPHQTDTSRVYASTPLGVYEYDGAEWDMILSGSGNWHTLKTDLTGAYLAVASEDKIYLSDDGGSSWSDVSGNIPVINDIYLDTDGDIYAATDSFPYKYDGSAWSRLASGFLDYGVMNQVKMCHSIEMLGTDTLIAGTDNGAYFSVNDGTEWFENNQGLDPFVIDSAMVAEVDAYLEDAVPADASTGAIEMLTDEIGPVPDVDGDDQLHFVLLDIYEDGDDETGAYFDATNQDASADYSNGMDMIYVDIDDVIGWNSSKVETKEAMVRSMVDMIEWNYDDEEEEWMVMGFGGYGLYLVNTGPGNVDSTNNQIYPRNLLADTNRYLFVQYLKDKYGTSILDDFNTAIGRILDPQTGNIDIVKLQGRTAIDTILAGETPNNFQNAFKDWLITAYNDNLTTVKKIFFQKFNILTSIDQTGMKENTQPYFSGKVWEFTESPVVFNGNEDNDFNLFTIVYNGTSKTVTEIPASSFSETERNLHTVSWSGDSMHLLVEVISGVGPEPAYNLSIADYTQPQDFVGVLQSPLVDRFLRVYYYADTNLVWGVDPEAIKLSIAKTNKRFLDAGVEGVNIMYGYDTTSLARMEQTEEGYGLYYTDIAIPARDTTVDLSFWSEDLAGNEHEFSVPVTIKSIGIDGGFIASADREMRVDIPANSLNKKHRLIALKSGGRFCITPRVELNSEATLSIDVTGRTSGDLSIYRKDGDRWIEIPTQRQGDKLTAEINSFGEFSVSDGEMVTNIPATLELSTRTFNPFEISYSVPERSNVRIDVYNSLGQRINTIENGMKNPGIYTLKWNGRTENGANICNGIYFYKLSTNNKSLTRKIILVR